MIIVYESKTGFTKRYAEMLAKKMGLKAFTTKQLADVDKKEGIIFLGWLKVGNIKGLNKLQGYNVKAVCGSGMSPLEDLDVNVIKSKNKISDVPFFYMRGGCLPLNELKGMDKIMLSFLVMGLKKSKDKNPAAEEVISGIVNGFNAVEEKNLAPVLELLSKLK